MVSGRPISFIQNMDTPLYVMRPQVQIFAGGSAPPQSYGETVSAPVAADESGRLMLQSERTRQNLNRMAQNGPQIASGLLYNNVTQAAVPVTGENLAATTTATGEETGDLFSYTLENAFSLERERAAMIPILGGNIGGEPVTVIRSAGYGAVLPSYNGFFLENSTKSHLPTGPITVFSGGTYAGDALTNAIAPGETRLISYAQDLNLSAKLDRTESLTEIRDVSVFDGKVQVVRAQLRRRFYLFRNKDEKPKKLVLLQADEPDFKLSDPNQPFDKSTEGYRFRLEAKGRETTSYTVQSERLDTSLEVLTGLDVGVLTFYADQKSVAPEVRTALLEVARRRTRWNEVKALRASKEAVLNDLVSDQDRIRNNMGALSESSQLRKQYEAKLAAQEPKVEALREELAKLRDEEAAAEKEFGTYTTKVRASKA